MATQVQNRRGTTAEHSTFTGANGELTVDTTKRTLVVHDGATVGGRPLLREDQSNLPTSAPTTGIYNASGSLAISTGGSGRLFVASDGKIGCGISAPSYGLQLINSASSFALGETGSNVRLILNYGSPTSSTAAPTITSDGVSLYYYGRNGYAGQHIFYSGTSNTERLRITSAGLVGVGTSSPQTRLHIQDAANTYLRIERTVSGTESNIILGAEALSNAIYSRDAASGNKAFEIYTGTTPRLHITAGGLVGVGTTSPGRLLQVSNTSGDPFISILGSAGNGGGLLFGDNASDAVGQIRYDHSTDAMYFVTNSTERLRIDSSGRVGIGTSTTTLGGNPFRLAVVGTKTYSELIPRDGLAIADNTATAQGVGGSITLHGIYDGSGNYTAFGGIEGQKENGTSGNYAGALVLKSRTFLGNLNEAIRIDSAQRVGIGTTSASANLHVSASSGTAIKITETNNGVTGALQATSIGPALGSDTNHPLVFYTNAVERLRIDSSGRLLVGTSSTSKVTSVLVQGNSDGSTNEAALRLNRGQATPADGATLGVIIFGDSAHSDSGYIFAARDAGTWSASSKPTRLVFSTTADGASSPTERMRIDNAGRTWWGRYTISGYPNATPGVLNIYLNSGFGVKTYWDSSTTSTHYSFENLNGQVGSITTNGGGTAFNTSSDYRLKENVAPLVEAIKRVSQLQVHRFNFISDPNKTVDGFLAHEVQTIVPEAITGEKDAVDDEGNPEYQGIDQSKLVPLLTAALQEAIGEIESLKARVAALESA